MRTLTKVRAEVKSSLWPSEVQIVLDAAGLEARSRSVGANDLEQDHPLLATSPTLKLRCENRGRIPRSQRVRVKLRRIKSQMREMIGEGSSDQRPARRNEWEIVCYRNAKLSRQQDERAESRGAGADGMIKGRFSVSLTPAPARTTSRRELGPNQ